MAKDLGSTVADAYIGAAYICGEGVSRDVDKGLQMLNGVIDSDKSIEAMRLLGVLYSTGDGLERSPSKAIELLESVATIGNVPVFSELADLYLDKDSDHYDENKALNYLIKGSQQRDLDCVSMLIDRCSKGDITGLSTSEIEYWRTRYDELDSLIFRYEW